MVDATEFPTATCATCASWTRDTVTGGVSDYVPRTGTCSGLNFCDAPRGERHETGCALENDWGAHVTVVTHQNFFCAAHQAFATR